MRAIWVGRRRGRVRSSKGRVRPRSIAIPLKPPSRPTSSPRFSSRSRSCSSVAAARAARTVWREAERGRRMPSRPRTTRAGSQAKGAQRGRRSRARLGRHRRRPRAHLRPPRPHAVAGRASRPRRRRHCPAPCTTMRTLQRRPAPRRPQRGRRHPRSPASPHAVEYRVDIAPASSSWNLHVSLTLCGCAIYLQPVLKVCLTSPAARRLKLRPTPNATLHTLGGKWWTKEEQYESTATHSRRGLHARDGDRGRCPRRNDCGKHRCNRWNRGLRRRAGAAVSQWRPGRM